MSAALPVFAGAAFIAALVFAGLFDNVTVELGLGHYAESPYWLGSLMELPANTLINGGYMAVGLYWLVKIYKAPMAENEKYYFDVFNFMAMTYGPTQLMRILTQQRFWAILDQWYTLPFFGWLVLWNLHLISLQSGTPNKFSSLHHIALMAVSCSTYCLALICNTGFEIALGIHISLAVTTGLKTYTNCGSSSACTSFWLAILFCCGFVGLKLFDLSLPSLHKLFRYISGHFLSKICDCLQIHYVDMYQYYCFSKIKSLAD